MRRLTITQCIRVAKNRTDRRSATRNCKHRTFKSFQILPTKVGGRRKKTGDTEPAHWAKCDYTPGNFSSAAGIRAASETNRPGFFAPGVRHPPYIAEAADRAGSLASPAPGAPAEKSLAAGRAVVAPVSVVVRTPAAAAALPPREASRIAIRPRWCPNLAPPSPSTAALSSASPFVQSGAAPAPPAGSRRAALIPADVPCFAGNAAPFVAESGKAWLTPATPAAWRWSPPAARVRPA